MPGSTDKRRQKRDAVQSVALFVLLRLACALGFGALCRIPGLPRWAGILLAVLAALCALLVLPALWVLKKRFQEIEGGEYDAAVEY